MAVDPLETRRQRALDALADGASRTWTRGDGQDRLTITVAKPELRIVNERRVLSVMLTVVRDGVTWFADQINMPNPATAIVTNPGDHDADPPISPTVSDNPRAALRRQLEETVRVSTKNFTRIWDKRLPGGGYSGDTLSVRAAASDGRLSAIRPTWDTTQSGGTVGSSTTTTTTFVRVSAENAGAVEYNIAVYYADFDTQTIPDDTTVDDYTFTLYGTGVAASDSGDMDLQVRLFDWGGSLTTADWINFATATNWTGLPLLATLDVGSWVQTSGTANDCVSQGATASINKTGHTYIAAALSGATGSAPPDNTDNAITFYAAEQAGTASDPLLVVNYSIPTSQTLTPSAVVVTIQTATPTAVGASDITLTPSAVAITIQTATPTITGALAATPSPVATTIQTAVPAVIIGAFTATPNAVAVLIQTVAPTLVVGASILVPSPVVVLIAVATPTVFNVAVVYAYGMMRLAPIASGMLRLAAR